MGSLRPTNLDLEEMNKYAGDSLESILSSEFESAFICGDYIPVWDDESQNKAFFLLF